MRRLARRARNNSIASRCQQDAATQARLRFEPWYLHLDRQRGAHVYKDGQDLIMLCSNDYLGLTDHPKVQAAAQEAIRTWGTSTTGARMANGSRSYHRELEDKLAAFLNVEACQVLSAGYLACQTSIATFAQKGDLILVDRNVHSSLWAGINQTPARVERFAHNNPRDLEDILRTEDKQAPKLLVIEGIYSMEGHVARLREMLDLSAEHNCFVVLDDAHGFGVLGERGQGTVNHCGCEGEVDLVVGSLSKSLASTGGFLAGDKALIEYLRTHSKQTIFSAALSPSQAAAASTSLDVLINEPEHRARLWENTRYYLKGLRELGIDTWGSETPAVPLVVGDRERTYRIWKQLLKDGVFTVMAIAPAVPPGKDLLRTAVSARLSRQDLDKALEAIGRAFKKLA